MNHKASQPKMPDRMEAVFDAAYLVFDLIAGILFFTMAQGRKMCIRDSLSPLPQLRGISHSLVGDTVRSTSYSNSTF